MLKNTSDAEDLTQQVFLRLFRKIGTFRGDACFSTWLHRVAVNAVLMHLRRKRSDEIHANRSNADDANVDASQEVGVSDAVGEPTAAVRPARPATASTLAETGWSSANRGCEKRRAHPFFVSAQSRPECARHLLPRARALLDQQSFKPLRVTAGFQPDTNCVWQRSIKPLGLTALVFQPALDDLARLRIQHRNLLEAGMKIAS